MVRLVRKSFSLSRLPVINFRRVAIFHIPSWSFSPNASACVSPGLLRRRRRSSSVSKANERPTKNERNGCSVAAQFELFNLRQGVFRRERVCSEEYENSPNPTARYLQMPILVEGETQCVMKIKCSRKQVRNGPEGKINVSALHTVVDLLSGGLFNAGLGGNGDTILSLMM